MNLVLYGLLLLFIVLCILLAMIFFIPIVYSVEGAKDECYFFTIRISWLRKIINIIVNKTENKKMDFFMVIFGFKILLYGNKKAMRRSKKENIKKQKGISKKKREEFGRYFSLFQQTFLGKVLLLIKRLLGHVLPKKYYLRLIYGFEDPADTGMLTGLFFMLFPNISNNDIIKIHPVFDEEVIQGEISIKGRIIVAVVIYYFLQFYFAEGVRQTIKKIRIK